MPRTPDAMRPDVARIETQQGSDWPHQAAKASPASGSSRGDGLGGQRKKIRAPVIWRFALKMECRALPRMCTYLSIRD